MSLRAEGVALSDVGRRRVNEDAWLCDDALGLYAAIDGMGGHAGGALAARLARDTLAGLGLDPRQPAGAQLAAQIVLANNRIVEHAAQDPQLAGMGCVLVATLLDPAGRLVVAHVGDCRAIYHDGRYAERLTRDHTPIERIAEEEALTERQAMQRRGRNLVERDLGREPRASAAGFVELSEREVRAGGLLLLATDGLAEGVDTASIVRQMEQAGPGRQGLQALASGLVAMALDTGVKDNVTVVAVRFIEDGLVQRDGGTAQPAAPVTRGAGLRRVGGWLGVFLAGALAGYSLRACEQPAPTPDDTGLPAAQEAP